MLKFYLEIREAISIAKALTPCMTLDPSRHYLDGVCLDASSEGLFAVASDGHRLGRLKLKMLNEAGEPVALEYNFQHIIPRQAVETLGRFKPDKKQKEFVCFEITDGKVAFTIFPAINPASWIFPLVDGQFPEWRRTVPSTPADVTAAFNVDYLIELCRAAKAQDSSRTTLVNLHIRSASAPATLEINDNLSFVLMPARF